MENVSDPSRHLTIDLNSSRVSPHSTLEIPIHFHPLTLGAHTVNCSFLVDSRKYPIKISGEAIKPCLQLIQAQDKHIDLGKMILGTVTKRVIEVVNRTPTTIPVSLNLWENLPSSQKTIETVPPEFVVPTEIQISQRYLEFKITIILIIKSL